MTVTILVGDVREKLRTLADNSVHCVVTSPPYWGLRNYGVDGQIGLEASPAEFIATMVAVFEEVRRVLRPDGTCWINMGDSYNSGSQSNKWEARSAYNDQITDGGAKYAGHRKSIKGLKHKDLCMMPHRLAIALQDAGWYVRQDIVWSKPNPMPESVRDRCTKAHEYIFLLTKSERYCFDADAIAEPASWDAANTKTPDGWDNGDGAHGSIHRSGREKGRHVRSAGPNAMRGQGSNRTGESGKANREGRDMSDVGRGATRNKRSVWTMATKPFSEAHFATFPPELPETCIKAGCPPGGTVLDPFFGAGTTGLVADRLQRNCIGIELNPAYAEIARKRIQGDSTLLTEVRVAA